MLWCDRSVARHARRLASVLLVVALTLACAAVAEAQNFVTGRSVGGVSIDPMGIMANVELARGGEFDKIRLEAVPNGMKQASNLRKISLKRLNAYIDEQMRLGKPLPEAVHCMAGLQQIRYVLVYPDQQDIVLAGFGEGWKLDKKGVVVGETTGRPVLLLDDFLTALRSLGGNVRSPMQVSIDPTPEGMQRLAAFAKRGLTPDPNAMSAAVEGTLGPQTITIAGVPGTSHFARVMVAADYRMKRISMGLEPSPVAGLPPFTDFLRAGGAGMSNMLPRWWLEPNYDALLRDADGLSWEIRGGSVKAMAENDFFDAHGIQRPTGKTDAASQRWADAMTSRYPDLAKAEPVFGQLRNCMDLAVAAALLHKENLAQKARVDLGQLFGAAGAPTAKLDAPKQVASKSAVARKGKKWMIAAGGVALNPWSIVDKAQTNEAIVAVRMKAATNTNSWWWD